MSAQSAIQTAIYNALIANEALGYAITAVYDHVPQDAVFPYVVIGSDTLIDWDTDNSTGFEATLTLHVWSRYRGLKECKDIQGLIYSALHRQPLTIDGYTALDCLCEYHEADVDPDGLTRHGVQRFRVVFE